MEKKMRGIADPFTLGIVLALIGSVSASNLTGDSKSTTVQSVDSGHLTDSTMVVLKQDDDE